MALGHKHLAHMYGFSLKAVAQMNGNILSFFSTPGLEKQEKKRVKGGKLLFCNFFFFFLVCTYDAHVPCSVYRPYTALEFSSPTEFGKNSVSSTLITKERTAEKEQCIFGIVSSKVLVCMHMVVSEHVQDLIFNFYFCLTIFEIMCVHVRVCVLV